LYSTGRYFTVTGDLLLGAPATIEMRQAQLNHFYAEMFPARTPGPETESSGRLMLTDRVLLQKAQNATNGPAVARLWAGDTTGYPSHSEADLALCSHLAFYTGRDPERIDRLFRQSGLMRGKWDERRGAETYGAQTIARALESATACYDPGRAIARAVPASHVPTPAGVGSEPDRPLPAALAGSGTGPVGVLPILRRLVDIAPAPVAWLWPGRLARGKLTVLAGDPGLGKSYVTLDIAARLTTGAAWPDEGAPDVGDVVLLNAEDGAADTIRPRLDALGGDPNRVHILEAVRVGDGPDRMFSLAADLPALEVAIGETAASLVIIDPLSAYLGGKVDSYKDADVRSLLAPLAALAERHDVAVLLVMHLTKNPQSKALYRTPGSIAFVAAARVTLIVAKDPEDEHRRLLVHNKNNLSAAPATLAYRLGAGANPTAAGPILWEAGPVDGPNADVLLAGTQDDPAERGDADALLRELLDAGEVASTECLSAARANGIGERTLYRAKRRLGIQTRRVGGPGKRGAAWYWSLPTPEWPAPKAATAPPKAATPHNVAALEQVTEKTDETTRSSPKAATSVSVAALDGSLSAGGSLTGDPTRRDEERL
jgi:hypothetical protein